MDEQLANLTHDDLVKVVHRQVQARDDLARRLAGVLAENADLVAVLHEYEGELTELKAQLTEVKLLLPDQADADA